MLMTLPRFSLLNYTTSQICQTASSLGFEHTHASTTKGPMVPWRFETITLKYTYSIYSIKMSQNTRSDVNNLTKRYR